VRLVYLDEAGSDHQAPSLVVAGVIVHGDQEWTEVDRRILELIDLHVSEESRPGFVFHATDIFHGSRYFDRRKPEWANPADRWRVLHDLARIIEDLKLPVVAGSYKKEGFGAGVLSGHEGPSFKNNMIQDMAVLDCLLHADAWLETYAPTELAAVIHEDGTSAKRLIKHSVRALRNERFMAEYGLDTETAKAAGLPLKRIIDTVHFVEKADARCLQLADLCAFTLSRSFRGLNIPQDVIRMIYQSVWWIVERKNNPTEARRVLAGAVEPEEGKPS
jgi:hypothetical protein